MQFTLICGILISGHIVATSGLIDSQPRPQVLQYYMDTANMPNSYQFHYDSSDGSSRSEQGSILDQGTQNAALNVLGTVRYYDDKGNLYEMTYKAGKRGYRTIIKKIS